ncbi:MAG: Type II secretion system protein E [bacterium]|nr:Type II secretion system protein E [bacterium]
MAKPEAPNNGNSRDFDIDSLLESAGLVGSSDAAPDESEAGTRVKSATAPKEGGSAFDQSEAGQTLLAGLTQAAGYSSEEEMLVMLAEKLGMEFIRMKDYEIDPNVVSAFPAAAAHYYAVFPIKWEDGALVLAMADPTNIRAIDDIEQLVGHPVRGAVAREMDVIDLIDEYYGQVDTSIERILESINEEDINFEVREDDIGNLEKLANQPPIIKLVNLILLQAVKDRASDLHLEPFQESFRIRYRVDGALHETKPPPKQLWSALVSRIKVMSNMDISEYRMPQDGRIKVNISGREVDMRVSSLPTVCGESIVLRILDRQNAMVGLEQSGLTPENLTIIEKIIKRPNGILLVTGPTGSGKTTTLYGALQRIYNPELKIITVENPVEYEFKGVVQVNINPEVGLTFASCLRAILRQDPDVIMVGEIRDSETAQIAIEASLTGHLVLSTLHTNDAPSAVTRLTDMGVEPFLITSSVEAVVAQRLVRTICNRCKQPYTPSDDELYDLGVDREDVSGVTFYKGMGCDECNFSGYKGRLGIFEVFVLSQTIRDMVLARAPSSVIFQQAREEGMLTMREDGWKKIVLGLTTIEEVVRETQE